MTRDRARRGESITILKPSARSGARVETGARLRNTAAAAAPWRKAIQDFLNAIGEIIRGVSGIRSSVGSRIACGGSVARCLRGRVGIILGSGSACYRLPGQSC